MKTILLSAVFAFTAGAFGNEFEGVPMNCLHRAEGAMAREKAMSLVAVCRDRKSPNKEFYTFSDGSRLTGFTAHFNENSCQLKDWWHGQDDQDQIDEEEWKQNCLSEADFKKPTAGKVRAGLTELNVDILGAQVYTLKGNVKGLSTNDVAQLVAKEIRHARYSAKFQIESHSLNKSSVKKSIQELSKKNGEARALNAPEIVELYSWIEDKKVEEVYSFTMNLSQQGGSAIEEVLIFLPIEKDETILAITRDVYAE